ncbi:leucine zipper domain-containing protein [Cyanobium gracile UHCC 0139]|uniref:Leucine zipper domain-containing protein n=1 Tax=Cyanobium gracile UHCC 0139 TaxID=3110308 RepID=A0ABU5RWP4_9CYAN|nr:leucine zipper domain-containing protein [Cyanobium gracile]MEA5392128.1 leucine zipper domain-containing protein [Cyanobium gracile UHCC 0139]
MHSHPSARLTPVSRQRLISRHHVEGVPLMTFAVEARISLSCACNWLAHFRSGGQTTLTARHSVRRTQRRRLDPEHLQ